MSSAGRTAVDRAGAAIADVRCAARSLIKQRGVTALAVLTLALGIGATTAIFSVVRAVLLTHPPFAEPHELVVLSERNAHGREYGVAWPNYLDWRGQARSFAGLAAYRNEGFALTLPEGPLRVYGGQVSSEDPLVALRAE